MFGNYRLNVEGVESIVAFIKNHEFEEIPEDVWEICMEMQEFLEENV